MKQLIIHVWNKVLSVWDSSVAAKILLFWTIYTCVLVAAVGIDLAFNPWLYSVAEHWHWYNYLTTQHAIAIAVVRHNYALPAIVGGLIAAAYAFFVSRER